MLWLFVWTGLAFCGIAVLGVLAIRVHLEVRRLSASIAAGSRAIAGAAEEFQRTAEPLAVRAGEIARR
ncbi:MULTISPECIES: hypothetical protein [Streptomycetaceae]|uniref:Uncharacterized protein n=1 Tax=Streptantibioticus parmotrematis TaxID=2873249 RepID=A0ABS7QMJ1_9ACTN|nr:MULTISPECIES: hypothetical protein [Streptomycetaceae]MBY8884405.1 hypothetical protein [Streptantibioticus parmotrematis]PWI41989.1 hypothetical protein CK485_24745 [Streptomyces sp. ICBB 8177]